jgi:hypothetical protein
MFAVTDPSHRTSGHCSKINTSHSLGARHFDYSYENGIASTNILLLCGWLRIEEEGFGRTRTLCVANCAITTCIVLGPSIAKAYETWMSSWAEDIV